MAERWRPVVGHEGSYSVSSQGNIRSEQRMADPRNVRSHHIPEKVLAPGKTSAGYYVVNIYGPNGRRNQRLVHRLVLEAFVGPCPPGMECCHGDDNKTNNTVKNLRWGTRAENIADRRRQGPLKGCSKLTETDVHFIRHWLRKGYTNRLISKKFGISDGAISRIKRGKSWTLTMEPK